MSEFAYIAIKTCGCVVAASVDNPEHKKETAKFVAAEVRAGLVIERVSVGEARQRLSSCKCKGDNERRS